MEAFDFVRDEADILPPGQLGRADEELRELAQRTGVFGVVVTVAEGADVDPPEVYGPIIDEVRALGGEALVTICSPQECGPSAGMAHSDGLDEAVADVPRDAAPPVGSERNLNQGLREWLAYVAEVAAADR